MASKQIKGKKGTVLLIVVFLVFLIAVFVTGVSLLASTDLQIAQNQRFSLAALYVAQAGIDRAIYELQQNNTWNTGFAATTFPAGGNATYIVTVNNSISPIITLDSTGIYANKFKRRVVVRLIVSPTSIPYPVRMKQWQEIPA